MFGIKLKNYEILEPFGTLQERTKKFILPMIIEDVLKGIYRIQPRIHKIVLSGFYLYKNINDKFGPLWPDDTYKPFSIRPYRKRAFKNYKKARYTFYTNPGSGFMPQCQVVFQYKNHNLLYEFYELFPQLRVSSVEYSLDFICGVINRPQKVRNLFLLFRHYFYSQRKRDTIFYDDRENFTYYIGANKKFKIYERGKDFTRHDQGWNFKDLDRIRIEYTSKAELKKYDLKDIENFILDCKFVDLMKNRFEFRKFKDDSENLPKDWQNYNTECKKGKFNGFQEEYLIQKKKGELSSLGEDTCLVSDFTKFQNLIDKKIASYNELWKKRTQLILKQK
jgi:hypothetical protein